MQPMPVGAECTDGQGSTGVAIRDPQPPAPVPAGPGQAPPGMTFTCQFDNGPRAGQLQSYAGVTGIQPFAVHSACTDGQGSTGTAVPDVTVGPVTPPPPQPIPPSVPEVAPPVEPVTVEPPAPAPAAPAVSIPPNAAVGARVGGVSGAVWADLNNDGVVDGYVANGQYYPGIPAGYTGEPTPPPTPAFVPPPPASVGERG